MKAVRLLVKGIIHVMDYGGVFGSFGMLVLSALWPLSLSEREEMDFLTPFFQDNSRKILNARLL